MEPVGIIRWIEEHGHELKPPVCNKLVYGGSGTVCPEHECGQWQCMIVGGPNERNDYHIEMGEEFFFQVRFGNIAAGDFR